MNDAVVEQNIYSLAPYGLYHFVFRRRHCEDFGERHFIGNRDVVIIEDAVDLLHGKQCELAFKFFCSIDISHSSFFLCLNIRFVFLQLRI